MQKDTLFQIFKYSVYLLIFINVIEFTREDYLASAHTFRNGIDAWSQFFDAYATTLDSIAWFVLLLMFELETYVIPDEKFVGKTRWAVQITGIICLLLVLQAFIGYWDKYTVMDAFALSVFDNACSALGTVQSYATDLDEYFALNAQNCAAISGTSIYIHDANSLLASSEILDRMKSLALTDVINAGTWILIVIVLEIDVLLQMRGELTHKLYRINVYFKSILYFVLFAAAVYWGISSALLDFWDAMLWIIAFFFIELNLFQWNEETTDKTITSQEVPL